MRFNTWKHFCENDGLCRLCICIKRRIKRDRYDAADDDDEELNLPVDCHAGADGGSCTFSSTDSQSDPRSGGEGGESPKQPAARAHITGKWTETRAIGTSADWQGGVRGAACTGQSWICMRGDQCHTEEEEEEEEGGGGGGGGGRRRSVLAH